MGRFVKRLIGVGVLAGVTYVVWRAISGAEHDVEWTRQDSLRGHPTEDEVLHVPPGVQIGGGPETEAPAEPLVEGRA
jgi:hypothetical protein